MLQRFHQKSGKNYFPSLSSGTGFSSHWVPYWRQCTPCNFDYNMIGKLETAMDDLTVSERMQKINTTYGTQLIIYITQDYRVTLQIED